MEAVVNTENKIKKIKLDFKDSKYATGRRKKSIAKVWIKKGSGNIHINGLKMNDYFKRPVHQIIVTRPLEISKVSLILFDQTLKKDLKKDKLTTRDSRVVERKKYGHRKARRSFQFSKR